MLLDFKPAAFQEKLQFSNNCPHRSTSISFPPRGIQFSNCLNAGRIWSSTPQIAENAENAENAEFRV